MRPFLASEVHTEMCNLFKDIHNRYGTRCSEALYQRACVRRAYLNGLPVMAEREMYVNFGDGNFLIGRVDLEVANSCLYELKVGSTNVQKDSEQVRKYLDAYDRNGENIQIASLVYFTAGGVVLHDVRNHVTESL